jgi:acyl-CoA dehydrogenase
MDNDHPAYIRLPPWVKAKLSPKATVLIRKVYDWVETECVPAEPIMKAELAKDRWKTPKLMHDLRKKAKAAGLFNLFLPNHFKESPGLTNLEYACCAEIMGRCYWAAQVCRNISIVRCLG